jgi:hypothetical protein
LISKLELLEKTAREVVVLLDFPWLPKWGALLQLMLAPLEASSFFNVELKTSGVNNEKIISEYSQPDALS